MDEKEPKKKGRPKKKEPIYNETSDTLLMSQQKKEEKVTLEDLQAGYQRILTLAADSAGNMMTKGSKAVMPVFGTLNSLNPFLQNERLKMINTLPSKKSKEEIVQALQAPQSSEQTLRASSWALAATQYLYYKILRGACDIPVYKYYKVPELLSSAEYKSKEFQAEDELVDEWLEVFGVARTLKQKAMEVKRDGKSTYLVRSSIEDDHGKKHVNYATLEKLPTQYVKLTGIGQHGYIASFNMMLFCNPAFSPSQYSEYIQNVWDQMMENGVISKDAKGINQFMPSAASKLKIQYKGREMISNWETKDRTYLFWVQLPQEICYTFASDMSHPWVVPDTAQLFLDLQELTDYAALAGLIASTPLTAILTGEAEYVDNAQPGKTQTKINPEILKGLQDAFNAMTSTNTEAFFAPLKNIQLLSLPNTVNSNEMTSNAIKNFITTSGEGGIIIASDKPSIAQVKGAQLLAESQYDFVTRQFEDAINTIINKLLGLKYHWKIRLWGGIYTMENEKKFLKEAVMSGDKFLMPKLLSSEDLTIRDAHALDIYIDSLDIYDKLEKVALVGSAEDETKNPVGRPAMDEGDVENDATAASKDAGNNVSENKMI